MWCRLVIFVCFLYGVTVCEANGSYGTDGYGTSAEVSSSENPSTAEENSSTGSNPNEESTAMEETSTTDAPSTITTTTEVSTTVQPTEGFDLTSGVEYDDETNKVCFPHVGCFSTGAPWTTLSRPILTPLSPAEIQTRVYFYSKENPTNPIEVYVYPRVDLGNATFNSTRPTCFIIHGFSSNGTVEWVKLLKDAYLKHRDANIFIVDWGKGASGANYLQVVGNTRMVGRQIALLVKTLVLEYGANLSTFHLIGHSLGAHICGYVAKHNPGTHRITACDPAQPGFELQSPVVRLDRKDADFVDVIHTNAKPFIPTLGFGMIQPIGDVDFYMNGGYDQPGCLSSLNLPEVTSFGEAAKLSVEVLAAIVSCSHGRSYEYLIEAFDRYGNCTFWGRRPDTATVLTGITNSLTNGFFLRFLKHYKCTMDICVPLGFDAELTKLRGTFFVLTNPTPPYCRGDDEES